MSRRTRTPAPIAIYIIGSPEPDVCDPKGFMVVMVVVAVVVVGATVAQTTQLPVIGRFFTEVGVWHVGAISHVNE